MGKVIMVQGTMSNVGKSFLVAGLCRIFKEDGYSVAPFKSQNMALNSYITNDGLEMGRAQVVQCEAAGIEPSVLMNPILLKPTTDMGSQVIVMGEVMGHMMAKEYFAYKKKLVPIVQKAFDTLIEQYDIVVIEGAGSPAEINLKQEDIVNMGMAKMADAPVLLVGDIDRGGVFAQLYGTMELLEKEEQERVKGLIINQFRGDPSLLESGITMLEEKCNRKVVGVVPFMDVDIEEEDSLSTRFTENIKKETAIVVIGVIRLPRLSNYTDFQSLESMEEVKLVYVKSPRDLKNVDMIIIPGTKSTMADLRWLRESGLEGEIQRQAENGTVVFGICGGYQMMGVALSDPYGTEGGGEVTGLCLLDGKTVFQKEKIRRQITGVFGKVAGVLCALSGCMLEGYEIHTGNTVCETPLLSLENREKTKWQDGAQKGNCYGTYVHGIFDGAGIAVALVSALCQKKGVSFERKGGFSHEDYKEKQYVGLAKTLREHLDMKAVYDILDKRN